MTLIPQHIVLQSPANNDPLLDLNTQPSLDLQFATSKTLDDRVSGLPLVNHQRDASSGKSAGTYVGSDGLIKTSVVNLATYSEQFDNAAWTKGAGVTITANTDTAPDGTLTADTFSSSSGNQISTGFIPVTASTTYTSSIYIKKTVGRAYTAGIVFNYDAGTLYGILLNTNDGTTVEATYTLPTTVLVQNSGEYWRISLTANSGSSVNVRLFVYPNMNVNTGISAGSQVIWGAQLEEGLTASTYIPTTTTISGAPRFDHDPVTLQSLGLLIEESRTNLVKYSEQFDQSDWLVGGTVSVVPNSALGPNGLMTADQITLGSTGARIGQFNLITTPGQTGTASVYLKNIDHVGQLTLRTGLAGGATYNLNLSLTSEWVRYELTTTHNGTQNVEFHIRESGATFSGSFLVWGAQLEAGSFPTSYIPTTDSAVTRAADVATIEGTNFSSWYNDSASTLYIESPDFPNYGNRSNSAFVYISDATVFNIGTGDGIKFGTGSPNTYNRVYVTEGGVTQADVNSPQGSNFAIAVSENDFNYTVDGTSVGTDNTVIMPTGMDRLAVTSYGSGIAHLSRLTYYPYRLADATLQEITS